MHATVETLKDAIHGGIAEGGWRRSGKALGKQLEDLTRMVEAFDLDVNVRDFPRTCQQIDHQPTRLPNTRRARGSWRHSEGEVELEDETEDNIGEYDQGGKLGARATREVVEDERRFPSSPRRGGLRPTCYGAGATGMQSTVSR
jgi:hypothetical protein